MPGNAALNRRVGNSAPCHDERQECSDDRSEVDEEGLDHESLGLLGVVQHIGHEGPERLHRDVEGQVHEQEDEGSHRKRGECQQRRAVRHQQESDGGNDGSAEDVGNPAAESRPGAVGEHSHDRLDDESGNRGCEPEIAEMAEVSSERLENAGCVGILQGISNLHSEESEAEIPYLPK